MKKVLLFGFICLTLLSCSKDGAQGPKGDTGAQGAAGTNGNANVRAFQYDVNTSNWTWNSTSYLYYVDLDCPAVTQNVMDYGFVIGYRYSVSNGTPIWIAMPNTFYPITNSNLSWTYEVSYVKLGGVRLRYIWSDSRQTPPTSQETFKVIVVSGTGKMANPGLDWSNYESVKNAFGLKD